MTEQRTRLPFDLSSSGVILALGCARQEKTKATFICQTNGRLLSKPEAGLVSKRLLNSIARCHVCDAALVYWNKGGKRVAKFYCSARQYKGAAGCSNNVGIPAEALDEAVNEAVPSAQRRLRHGRGPLHGAGGGVACAARRQRQRPQGNGARGSSARRHHRQAD